MKRDQHGPRQSRIAFQKNIALRPAQGRASRAMLRAFICPQSSRRSREDLKQEGRNQIYSFRKKIARAPLEKRLWQGKYKISLEHLLVPESKQMLKNK